jgi:hypothetical protein
VTIQNFNLLKYLRVISFDIYTSLQQQKSKLFLGRFVFHSFSSFIITFLLRSKAEAAADALRRILPTVTANSVVMTIPMPGHVVGGNPEAVRSDVARLEELFDSHDVVFLLLDSREARWLPTVLGKVKGKIVLNAALG